MSDWEALHEVISQCASSEFAAYDYQRPTAPEEIRKITDCFASGDSYLAVCLKDTGRLVRFVSLTQEQEADCGVFSIGCIFNFDDHGKGCATEACRAVIGHTLDGLQAQRVVTGTAAADHASCRLLERLGFKRMAESTASFTTTPDGKPIEFLGYTCAISKDEWRMVGKHGSAGTAVDRTRQQQGGMGDARCVSPMAVTRRDRPAGV